MKKLMLIMALAALSVSTLFAQDLTGTWQGTLQAGRDLRIVMKLTKDGNTLKATMHSIDQGGQGVPASTMTIQGSTVKIAVAAIGGTFEGKLSADGNSIAGSWSQGGPSPLPLNLTRATAETAWAIPEPPPPPVPMALDANPVFEVATIKPSNPETPGKAIRVSGRNFSTLNTTLSDLITFSYGLHPRQITGGPAWLESEKFDIAAKPDGTGQPNDKQWKSMIQKLLVERFQLTFHRDKKELTVFAITVAKGGSKLSKNETNPNGLPGLFFRGLGNLPARNATMADFAGVMQAAVLDRPVVDQTGLEGRYDFVLSWTPDETQFGGAGGRVPPPPDGVAAPPNLFTAMQEQLGLKMESAKAPVDVLVIDRVEKPSAN